MGDELTRQQRGHLLCCDRGSTWEEHGVLRQPVNNHQNTIMLLDLRETRNKVHAD
jgi:hypothetical protein